MLKPASPRPAVVAALALFGWCQPLWSADPQPEVRPIAAAEHRAAELAVAYLDRGPEAWWPALAEDSPIRRLGEAAALDELAVRAGPPDGARWVLQTPPPGSPAGLAVFSILYPSAVEETLSLLLVEEAGEWRIRELRSLADPARLEPGLWRPRSDPSDGSPAGAAAGPGGSGATPWAPALLLMGLSFLAVARAWRARSRGPRLAVWGLGLVTLAATAAACGSKDRPGAGAPDAGASVDEEAPETSVTRLGGLRELRWAIAAGKSTPATPVVEESAGEGSASESTARVAAQAASLWSIETQLWGVDLREAERLLGSLPSPAPSPLGSLLRARLAAVRGDADGVREHYEQALAGGIDHDGLRLEYAEVLSALGDSIGASVATTQLVEMGSRLAEAHYSRAQLGVLEGDPDRGETSLAVAWKLEPVLREDLLGDPLLATLCARPSLFPSFSFDSPEEPLVAAPARGERPLRIPASATADLAGELLRVEVGTAELFVPGGAELAPRSVVLETASDRNRREEKRALGRLPELIAEARTPAVLTRPLRTRQVVEAAVALARHNRWPELIELSDGMAQVVDLAPSTVTRLRAAALRHEGRSAEARSLLVRLARSSVANRRRDPGTLQQLAELLVASQEYEPAIRLMRKAASLTPAITNERRIRQVSMEQRLYEDPRFHRTRRLELVYPRRTGERHAGDLASVLEEEIDRLSHWIPSAGKAVHTVHLYPLVDFLQAYSGGVLVLGIYDGKLRVPLADVLSLHPQLVAVLSHELAHAMLAEATDDQAPKWFHEGLAQHVEMVGGRVNPIPDLHRTGRVLAFPMIEAILDGFGEAQLVDLAYGEAAWVVHYLEAEHGVGAIRRLIGSFSRGRTTEEALEEVLGMSVVELDRSFRAWCLDEAPPAWQPPERRRYEEKHDPYVRRAPQAAAARPSEPAAADRARMRSWHAAYSERTARLKRTLSRVVEPIRSGGDLPAAECRVVAEEAAEALADPGTLGSPDPAVGRHLEMAFQSLEAMGVACHQGDAREAARALVRAEIGLGRAAAALRAHGLQP